MEKIFRNILFIDIAKKLKNNFCRGVILFFFLVCCPAINPSGAAAGSEGKNASYLLSITSIEKDQFPYMSLRTFFAEERSGYKYPVFGAKFSAVENNVKLNISVKKLSDSQSIAFIIDRSLYNKTLQPLLQDAFKTAGTYIEGLDRAGIFGFTASILKLNFTSTLAEIAGVSFDVKEYDYQKTADDVFLYAINSLKQYNGGRHIIYVTGEDVTFETDEVMNELSEINQSDSMAVHLIKLNFDGETGFGGQYSYSQLIDLAAATGGYCINVPVEKINDAVNDIMQKIKSNYVINYETPQPYSNGRKRLIELETDYDNQNIKTSVDYNIKFNLPELQLENSNNPFFYQELDPLTILNADTLGLSLSVSVKFPENFKNKPGAEPVFNSKAVMGFACFTVDGKMCDFLYLMEFTNDFKCTARKIKILPRLSGNDLSRMTGQEEISERIETVFLKEGAGKSIKKCGIYWMPSFRNERCDQWARIFMSFMPQKIDLSGNKRYAVFLTGNSADAAARNIEYDGVQLQYGITPTRYSVDKMIYFGPEQLNQKLPQPINPRIEYQMK